MSSIRVEALQGHFSGQRAFQTLVVMPEIEATLIICSETPQDVVASVAALSSVTGYNLRPQPPVSIRDYYVDTTDRVLRQGGFNLRLREIDKALWITLKGPPKKLAEGIVERLEVEIPWSIESLAHIRKDLDRSGIQLPAISWAPGLDLCGDALGDSFGDTLAASRMELVQQLNHYRQIRIMPDGATPDIPALAELSIDSVVYHFGGRRIHHYEVEIEAKSEAGVSMLPALTRGLVEQYPSTLQRWGPGKLDTGRAIEALLALGQLQGMLTDGNELMPAAYPSILRYLQHKGT